MKRFLQFLLVLTFASALPAQEASTRKDTSEPSKKVYKAGFVVYELEDGKRINERTYVVPVITIDGNTRSSQIKIGTRVPVTSKEGQVQYVDVGLNLDCQISEQAGKYIVYSNVEISSFALPDQNADPRAGGNPVLRQIKEISSTLVNPGKPTLVTSIDDTNSKKRLQIEVTVTRME